MTKMFTLAPVWGFSIVKNPYGLTPEDNVGNNRWSSSLSLSTLEPQAVLRGVYMTSGIILQVWPIESIPKDVKHQFKTRVTYIIVGSTHSLQSILLWDYQLQFIAILSSLITMPMQNSFSQAQLPLFLRYCFHSWDISSPTFTPFASDIASALWTSLYPLSLPIGLRYCFSSLDISSPTFTVSNVLAFCPGNHLVDSWICLSGPEPSQQQSSMLGETSKIRELIAFS